MVKFFDVDVFLSSGSVAGPGSMSISFLVQELRQFSFVRIEQYSENQKYTCLSFVQYLEIGVSKGYQILRECL